jgi:DNA-binding LacI/PurR family transcriptional regulator
MARKKAAPPKEARVTLHTVAQHLGLTPGTVSAALNNSAASRSIPENTKARILAAARDLNYRPNYFARSLRLQRTYTIGIITEEIGDPYGAMVMSGVEEYLRKHNYFFLAVAHRHDQKVLQTYSQMLLARGVEGFITIDTSIDDQPARPTVAVAGHQGHKGVTNITLDEKLAARLALAHLHELGHEDIAFFKGSRLSSDSAARWTAICEVAADLGIRIRPELTVQIDSIDPSPNLGYPYGKELLARSKTFTALYAYNDISAMGAMLAFREVGLRVPQDVSVVGFDDIPLAPFADPGLTTIRQPLQRMGQIAAKTVIDQIEGNADYLPEIVVEPELVIRGSTGPVSSPVKDQGGRDSSDQRPATVRRVEVSD